MTAPAHELYDFQGQAVEAGLTYLDENPVIVMPTGSGKTFTAAALVRRYGRRTLWLAERRELVGQAAKKLRDLGLDTGVVLSGLPHYPNRPVQVASVQTLVNRDLPDADLIVIDECHHTPGRRMQDLLGSEKYRDKPRLGLTATPFRLDGKALGPTFGRLIVTAYPDELVQRGILIEPRVYAPPPPPLDQLKISKGEFMRGQARAAMDKPTLVGDVVQTWRKHAAGLRTALFAVDVEHSKHLIAQFQAAGIPAEHIDGKTPKGTREAILERLAQGKTLVVSNCLVITEGWDMPALQCAIIVRPTASLCLHLQIGGRVMRACQGKSAAVILDHAGNFLRHGRLTRRLEYSLHHAMEAAQDYTLTVCPRCQRMVLATRSTCPECGHALSAIVDSLGGGTGFSPRRRPEMVDGELEEFDAERDEQQRRQAEEELAREMKRGGIPLAYHRGYGVVRTREAI